MVNAVIVFLKVDIQEDVFVLLGNPFEVAFIALHMVAVFFFVEGSRHAEVVLQLIIGHLEGVGAVDLRQINVSPHNLLLAHNAVSAPGGNLSDLALRRRSGERGCIGRFCFGCCRRGFRFFRLLAGRGLCRRILLDRRIIARSLAGCAALPLHGIDGALHIQDKRVPVQLIGIFRRSENRHHAGLPGDIRRVLQKVQGSRAVRIQLQVDVFRSGILQHIIGHGMPACRILINHVSADIRRSLLLCLSGFLLPGFSCFGILRRSLLCICTVLCFFFLLLLRCRLFGCLCRLLCALSASAGRKCQRKRQRGNQKQTLFFHVPSSPFR